MIGAMPAIAVKGKKGGDGSIGFMGRPHKLSLHFRPPLPHHQVTPTPSPVNSPPGVYFPPRERVQHRIARMFLSKRIIFQLSVLAPLVGAILLFIGLVQLTPGAEASPYGIPLIIAGSATLLVGLLVILLRIYFTWTLNRLNMRRDVPQIKVNEPSVTDQDVEKGGDNATNNAVTSSHSASNLPNNSHSPSHPHPQHHAPHHPDRKGSVTIEGGSPKPPPRSRSKDRERQDSKDKDKDLPRFPIQGGESRKESK